LNKRENAHRAACFRWLRRLLLALTVAFAGQPTWCLSAAASRPDDTVAAFDTALQHAMQDAKRLGYQGRYDVLAPAMNQAFDFPTMTRIATGTSWSKISPDQQKALIDAFGRFSIATYANQFNGYSGERFAITGQNESPQGIVVATTMQPAKGDTVRFNYLMREIGGAWKIIDIYLDGTISQLAVRRGEFSAVLSRSGPAGLLQLLDERITALAVP
jgi:phospholipid transport system substrate-binding protein